MPGVLLRTFIVTVAIEFFIETVNLMMRQLALQCIMCFRYGTGEYHNVDDNLSWEAVAKNSTDEDL